MYNQYKIRIEHLIPYLGAVNYMKDNGPNNITCHNAKILFAYNVAVNTIAGLGLILSAKPLSHVIVKGLENLLK